MAQKIEFTTGSKTRAYRGMTFKDGDVSFKLMKRAIGLPLKWKVNQFVPGSMMKGNNGGEIEMTETKIVDLYDAYTADRVTSRLTTQGECVGESRRPRKDPANAFKRLYSLRQAIMGIERARA